MKKLLFFLCIMLSATVILTFLADDYSPFAQSGCCKQRRSTGEPWYVNGLNFGQCSNLNSQTDGDNVYAPSGRVWWDQNC